MAGMKFFIGGVVDQAAAGDVLAILFRSGAKKLDCSPYEEPTIKPGIKHPRVPALAPPAPALPDGFRSTGISAQVLQALTSDQPTNIATILERLTAAGHGGDSKRTYQALQRLVGKGLVTKLGRDKYALPPNRPPEGEAAAPAPAPPKTRNGRGGNRNQSEVVHRILQQRHPKTTTMSHLADYFEKHGLGARNSPHNAIAKLIKAGRVKRAALGEYRYIPE